MKEITTANHPAYHETKRHSDKMFAFNIYPCTIPGDFSFVPLHWQDSMEIIYIKEGTGSVQIDLEAFTAEPGDIFLVLPRHLHGLKRIARKRMDYENIIFDMGFLESSSIDICSQKYLNPLNQGRLRLPVCIRKDHPQYLPLSACLDAADRLCALRPNGYELGVKGQLMTLFSILFQEASDQEDRGIEDRNLQKLKTVLSRIEADYDKRLSVDDMAAECGYSTSHFMRWFKEAAGIGFSGYLIEYRLEKAAYALCNSDTTILEISEQTGFENLSNFYRLFKKRYEMTPNQFRKSRF